MCILNLKQHDALEVAVRVVLGRLPFSFIEARQYYPASGLSRF